MTEDRRPAGGARISAPMRRDTPPLGSRQGRCRHDVVGRILAAAATTEAAAEEDLMADIAYALLLIGGFALLLLTVRGLQRL